MNMETKAAQTVGDYDVRGRDFETMLIGHISEAIIDADRLVRLDWQNGFPNWAMYRCALAGDTLHRSALRRWVVAFTHVYCADGGIKRHAYDEDMATFAAWDAYSLLVHSRQVQPYTVTAEALGANPKTYRRLRDNVYRRLRASMDEYWIRMQVAVRQITISERKYR